jgi:orotidine-5'-phosphate decarboxylase
MATTPFIDKLRQAQQQQDSWLCIGLDPNREQMPSGMDILTFNKVIIDATHEFACAYKPNLAFYLAEGISGLRALQDTIAHVPRHLPVVLDAKFGDISYTAAHYARAAYDELGADAVTLTAYVGMDAVEPVVVNYPDKFAYVMVRSANTTSNDFQHWPTEKAPLFRYVTAQLNTLADKYPDRIGIAAAATQPEDLARIRCWAPNLPFLIAGLGVQGGDEHVAVQEGSSRTGIGPLLSVTRAIIYASQGSDFAEAAHRSAEEWVNRIRAAKKAEHIK